MTGQQEPANVKIDSKEERRNLKPKECWGTRHVVCLLLFLGMANAYIMRVNMSVAIVAMINGSAVTPPEELGKNRDCPAYAGSLNLENSTSSSQKPVMQSELGTFIWDTRQQGFLLSSFFWGYVITQIPIGILARRYGARRFLGYGLLLNSIAALFVPLAANLGLPYLFCIRVLQGLGEGPVVPTTHQLLSNWVPPLERSRLGGFVYSGAQFGTVISMPLSGLLAAYGFSGGWPSIFYVFGGVGIIWFIFWEWLVSESPEESKSISEEERSYVQRSLGHQSDQKDEHPSIPWIRIWTSLPFWAILVAHVGHNWGYDTLLTELPSYMKNVLHFDIKQNGFLSALPYLAMWLFSLCACNAAHFLQVYTSLSATSVRKIMNTIAQWSPAACFVAASFTGCDRTLTIIILTLGVGLNGACYSGFKVTHLDLAPRYAGVLMAITNCSANVAGIFAPSVAGIILMNGNTHANWRLVFIIAACVYFACNTFFIIFASAEKQSWNDPPTEKKTPDAEEQNYKCSSHL